MRWAEHVACVGERSGIYRVWWVSLKIKDHLQDLVIDGRVILQWILNKYDGFRPVRRQVTGYDVGFLTTVFPMIRC
jgi:hypothetical protein